ncbi:MAG: hypothetical protein H6742_17875 [Alphaproteobacteria bacterium]|nr:hypothetical protein [Alphaproteobacteria bacterium]
MPLTDLLDSRLLLVTGKGGTGKSSLAAACGRLSAERGKRVVVAEVDSFQSPMPGLLGRTPEFQPRPIARNLDLCNITWLEALEDWLHRAIHVQRVVQLILRNRLVNLFLDATPGVRETVILSRIAHLCDEYDQVVVDLPASGHAVGILQVPWVARELLETGPIRDVADQVIELLARPDSRLAIVALPEEMVVNETIELAERLRAEVPVLAAPVVMLNRATSPSLTADERTLLLRLHQATGVRAGDGQAGPVAELLRAGRWEAELEDATREAIARLSALQLTPFELPRLGALGGFQGGPDVVVQQMARALARGLSRELAGEPHG